VRFTVADTGPGFTAEQLPSLFDRFTKSEGSAGSGLGLAIARDLVLAHGGTIEATNRPAGGAVVSFRLPAGDR
jgi:signal transduction histidine kinase